MRHRVVPPQKRLTRPPPTQSSPSISASSLMAQKTLHQFLAPSSSHIPTRLHQDQAGNDGFELKTGLVNMSKQVHSVVRHPRMPMPISRTFWRWAILSTPWELQWISSAFSYSRSHCSGRPRCGFTPTRKLSQHGKLARMHSWPNTFQWERQMVSETESPVSSNYRMKPS